MIDHVRVAALRSRLLLIALGTGACDKGAPPAGPTPTPSPGLAAPTPAPPPAPPPPAPTPPPAPARTQGPPTPSVARTECYPPGGGGGGGALRPPNATPPPPPTVDANGCRLKEFVQDGCCNHPIEGPRFENNKCCYGWGRDGSCCGRPFLVAGQARVADVVRSDDWLTTDVGGLLRDSIDAHTRRALADAWLADAQMEHASIAAFARFVLQLVSLGAPASLIREAAAAAVDEQRHAALCFSIASELAGVPLGAAALPVSDALSVWSLGDVIAEVVVEGCIGETVAALMALRQLEGATEPNTRRVLEQIAADEARHAELAWRFLRWALDVGGAPAHEAARSAFAMALGTSSLPAVSEGVDAIAWRSLGRLSPEDHASVQRTAHEQVIGPCAEFLLASVSDFRPANAQSTIPVI